MKRLIFMLLMAVSLSAYCAEAAKEAPPILQVGTVTDMCSIHQAHFLLLPGYDFEAYPGDAGSICFTGQGLYCSVLDYTVLDCGLPSLLSPRLSSTDAAPYGLWRADNMEYVISYQCKSFPIQSYAKRYSCFSNKTKG